jgi:hypothetical protein
MKRTGLLLLLLLAAAPLSAQTIRISPANPTTNDVVQLINVPQCQQPLVAQSGFSFEIDAGNCFFEPGYPPIILGVFPPGTYTYHVTYFGGSLSASGSFVVVSAPPIPATSTWTLLALGVLLAAGGWVAVARS